MRMLFAAAAILLAGTANAATTKAVWNMPLDHPTNVAAGAEVTSERSGPCSGGDEACRDERGHHDRTQPEKPEDPAEES